MVAGYSAAPSTENIYHHNNSQSLIWGNDREMMTTDSGPPSGVYQGFVLPQQTATTQLKLAAPAAGAMPGGALCVVAGASTGECRRVVNSSTLAGGTLRPPAVPQLGMSLALVPCAAAGYPLSAPSASNGETIRTKAAPGLAFTVDCSSDNPVNPAKCGQQPYPERLILQPPDGFTKQFQTQQFEMEAGTLKLVKSGHCVAAESVTAGATIELAPCTHTEDGLPRQAAQWRQTAPAGTFELLAPGGHSSGLCIGINSYVGDKPDVFIIDRPFTVPLDSGSHITILPYTGHIAFNGNDYSDGGAVQIYGFSEGMQLMENRLTRTGGVICGWARVDGRTANHTVSWGASFRNVCIDNEVVEGNHVWNYLAGPNLTSDAQFFPYYPGGSKTIEPWFFGSLTNDQGSPEDPGPVFGADLALNRFMIFRGNIVRSHGGIVVRGSSANVLVENNRVENSRVGIHVNYTTTQGGVVLLRNILPAGVPDNFNPYAAPGNAPEGASGSGPAAHAQQQQSHHHRQQQQQQRQQQQQQQPHVASVAVADAHAAPAAAVKDLVAPPASLLLEEKLATLKRLHDRGFLSAEVYATRSAALLDASGL